MEKLYTMDFNPFSKFDKEWALVTSGTKEKFNGMTISWGGAGVLWRKNVLTVYIKPCRYTHNFMEENDYFTVSFFDESYKPALGIMGSKSGKDLDKVSEAKLTPLFEDGYIDYKEAKLTIVCKKIYSADFIKERVPEDAHHLFYEDEAEHTMYIGEIVKVIEK